MLRNAEWKLKWKSMKQIQLCGMFTMFKGSAQKHLYTVVKVKKKRWMYDCWGTTALQLLALQPNYCWTCYYVIRVLCLTCFISGAVPRGGTDTACLFTPRVTVSSCFAIFFETLNGWFETAETNERWTRGKNTHLVLLIPLWYEFFCKSGIDVLFVVTIVRP